MLKHRGLGAWPVSAAPNSAYLGLAESIGCRDCCLGSLVCADLSNLRLRQLVAPVGRAALIALSLLGLLIAHVVVMRSNEQMFGSNAQGVIATVAHASPVIADACWDFSAGQAPCNSVRLLHPSVEAELAVSGAVYAAGPKPAVAGSINLGPESVLHAFGGHAAHFITAEAA